MPRPGALLLSREGQSPRGGARGVVPRERRGEEETDMAGHTPGPWMIDQDNAEGVVVVGDNGDLVHEVFYDGIPEECGAAFREDIVRTCRLDAGLIASAPDLLEACKMFVDACENAPSKTAAAVRMARAAIAKAEGN